MSEDTDDYLWKKRYEALYRAQLSVLYHRKRERFFAFWDRAVTAVAIVGGSAAFAGLGGPDLVRWAAAVVAVTSTMGLVYGLAERARRHGDLARQFLSELPALGLLVLDCQNELAQARGEHGAILPLTRWQRMAMHFADYRPARA